MSFAVAAPGALIWAASDVTAIGAALDAANGAAMAPITSLLGAGEDEVSAAVAAATAAMAASVT